MDDQRSATSAKSGHRRAGQNGLTHRRVVGQGIGWQRSGDIWIDEVIGVLFGRSDCASRDKGHYRSGTGQRMIGNQ
jgi:hypothetical protein